MLILSLDSAGQGCAVCLWQDGEVLVLREEKMERGQDSRLIPMIQDAMQEANINYDNLDRIAVTRGPGSFTGLRIGLAAARGIALAANKPVLGIDRFAIHHAQQEHLGKDMLILLESRRAELYAWILSNGDQSHPPCLMNREAIALWRQNNKQALIAGDVADIPCVPLPEPETTTAAALAALADPDDPAFAPRPLYLRPPDVTLPKGQ